MKTIFFLILVNMSLVALDSYDDKITALVKENPGQMTYDEYRLIANIISTRKPCNLLVFGVGRDSKLWLDINRSGYTVFLEDSEYWLNMIKNQNPPLNGYLVKYGTHLNDWQKFLDTPTHTDLMA
jgi:glucuronoxylan 4-O-methyltransferase